MTSKIDQIDKQVLTHQGYIADAQRERDEIALQLLENPTDAKALENMRTIDKEIQDYSAKIDMLQAARRAAVAAESEEARAAKRTNVKAARDKAASIARSRVAVAEKIEKTIATLGELLKEWDSTGRQCQSAALQVPRGLFDSSERYLRESTILHDTARGTTYAISGALGNALAAAGVGNVGIPGMGFVLIDKPISSVTFEQAASAAADNLIANLDKLVGANSV